MCIHLFASDHVLTIPMLLEQLWFNTKYASIDIEEVYDVILHNDGPNEIHQLTLLYPNDITSGDSACPNIELLSIGGTHSKYDWYMLEDARRAPNTRRVSVAVGMEVFEAAAASEGMVFDCAELMGKVRWVKEIDGDVSRIDVLKRIKKALIEIELHQPLAVGDRGIIRLLVRPRLEQLDTESGVKIRPSIVNAPAYQFKWNATITSPDNVRVSTRYAFESEEKRSGLDDVSRSQIRHVRDVFVRKVRESNGAVRVESHKIAVIANNDADVTELARDDTIKNCGECRVPVWDSPSNESTRHLTVNIWLAGSNVNRKNDLLLTVFRIRDALKARGQASPEQLVWDLGGNDRHEALCLLIQVMLQLGLLVRCEEESHASEYGTPLRWPWADEGSKEFVEKICSLRRRCGDSSLPTNERALLSQFRDMHPFKLSLSLRWDKVPDGWTRKVRRLSRLKTTWSIVNAIIAIAAFVLSLLMWFSKS